MRSPAMFSRSSNGFRFPTNSCRPMPMSRWRRRRLPAISPWSRHRRTTLPIRSAARLKNTEEKTAVSTTNSEVSAALTLLSASAVRERAHRLLALAHDDKLPNFRIHPDRMDGVVDLVLQTTREAYPSLEVPFHSRWRHFVLNGDNRWAAIASQTRWPDAAAQARAEFDLAIVSVFLDAGAGPAWRYRDQK